MVMYLLKTIHEKSEMVHNFALKQTLSFHIFFSCPCMPDRHEYPCIGVNVGLTLFYCTSFVG